MTINAPEGYALEDFSAEAIRNQIAEAQKVASGSGSEQDIAEAKIEIEVRSHDERECNWKTNNMTHRFSRPSPLTSNKHPVASEGDPLYINFP